MNFKLFRNFSLVELIDFNPTNLLIIDTNFNYFVRFHLKFIGIKGFHQIFLMDYCINHWLILQFPHHIPFLINYNYHFHL